MKYIKDSQVEIKRIVKEGVDRFGRVFKRVKREILTNPLNFGSVNKPLNSDVLSFKIEVSAKN